MSDIIPALRIFVVLWIFSYFAAEFGAGYEMLVWFGVFHTYVPMAIITGIVVVIGIYDLYNWFNRKS